MVINYHVLIRKSGFLPSGIQIPDNYQIYNVYILNQVKHVYKQ